MSLHNRHLLDKQIPLSKIKSIRIEHRKGKKTTHLLTPSFTAFRRKNALHGAQVGIVKLMPMAEAPHIRHGPRFRGVRDKSIWYMIENERWF